MYYKFVIFLNESKIEKIVNFKNNMCICKLDNSNISDILLSSKNNIIRVQIYDFDKKILDSDDILLPKKLYRMYTIGLKKLYTHCIELEEYFVCIDVMKIYKIRYFKSIFISKK